jgi:hypothetical protein
MAKLKKVAKGVRVRYAGGEALGRITDVYMYKDGVMSIYVLWDGHHCSLRQEYGDLESVAKAKKGEVDMSNYYTRVSVLKRRETMAARKAEENQGCDCCGVPMVQCKNYHPTIYRSQFKLKHLRPDQATAAVMSR